MLRHIVRGRATPYLVLIGAVLFANALYLLGVAHLDPWITFGAHHP